jgi:uncharacterized membrane protein YdjX (TVP38/TMEM64 family)
MKRVMAFIALVAAAAALHFGGVTERLAHPQQLREMILETGPWGYVVFLGLFTFVAPLGLPGFVFIVAASLIWPLPVALGLSLLGGVASGIFGFSFSRYIARDWVARHLPARFHRFDAQLAERGLRAVILVYLVFFLAPPTHWVLGLSHVRFLPFLAGCALGILPGTLALTYLGGNLVQGFSRYPWIAWPAVLLLGLVLLWHALRHPRPTGAMQENATSPRQDRDSQDRS